MSLAGCDGWLLNCIPYPKSVLIDFLLHKTLSDLDSLVRDKFINDSFNDDTIYIPKHIVSEIYSFLFIDPSIFTTTQHIFQRLSFNSPPPRQIHVTQALKTVDHCITQLKSRQSLCSFISGRDSRLGSLNYNHVDVDGKNQLHLDVIGILETIIQSDHDLNDTTAKRQQRQKPHKRHKRAPHGRRCVFCDLLRRRSHRLGARDEYGFTYNEAIVRSPCDYQLAQHSEKFSAKGNDDDNYNNNISIAIDIDLIMNHDDDYDEKRKYMGVGRRNKSVHGHWCHLKCLSFYLMLYNDEIQSRIELKAKEKEIKKNELNSNNDSESWNYYYDFGYQHDRIPLVAQCLKCAGISRVYNDRLSILQPKDLITGFVYQMYNKQKKQQKEEFSLDTFTIKVKELITRCNTYKEYLVALLRDFETETLKREYIEQATRMLATLTTKPKDNHDDKDLHVDTNYSSHAKLITRLKRLMFVNYSWLAAWLLVVFPVCVVLIHTIFKDNDSVINIIQISNLVCSVLTILCHILEIIFRRMLFKMEVFLIEFLGNNMYRIRRNVNINGASKNNYHNPQPLWPVFRAYNSDGINKLILNTFELQFIEQQERPHWQSNSIYQFDIKRKQYQKQQLRVCVMLVVVVLVCFVFMWIAPMETLRVNSDRLGMGMWMIIVTICAAMASWLIAREKSKKWCVNENYQATSAVYWGLMGIFAFIYGLLSVFTIVGDEDNDNTYQSIATAILWLCGPTAWFICCFGNVFASTCCKH